MKKAVLGAAAAVVFGAVAFSTSAEAQCWSDGYTYTCAAPGGPVYTERYWAVPWQTYPTVGYEYNGYKPQWLPSYPGPRASSGAGR
jgi:hypothetical protein